MYAEDADSYTFTDVSVETVTLIFRAYLAEQSMDHLSTSLRKGGVKDLLAFFPPNKRQDKYVEEHFRKAGLPQVADWWTKKQYAALKENIISAIKESLSNDEPHAEVCIFVVPLTIINDQVRLDHGSYQG